MTVAGEGHSQKKGLAGQMGHPNRDAQGPGNSSGEQMVFRAVSSSQPARRPQGVCRSSVRFVHPLQAIAVSAVTGGEENRAFAIALIRMFSTPLDWPPFPSRP